MCSACKNKNSAMFTIACQVNDNSVGRYYNCFDRHCVLVIF